MKLKKSYVIKQKKKHETYTNGLLAKGRAYYLEIFDIFKKLKKLKKVQRNIIIVLYCQYTKEYFKNKLFDQQKSILNGIRTVEEAPLKTLQL